MGLDPEPHRCAPGERMVQAAAHVPRGKTCLCGWEGRVAGLSMFVGGTDGLLYLHKAAKWAVAIAAQGDDRHTVEREPLQLCSCITLH